MQYQKKYYIYNISSSCSVPLVDLLGGRPVTSHGQHQTVLIEFSHSLNILAAVLPPLVGDESVALHGDGGRHLPPVRGVLRAAWLLLSSHSWLRTSLALSRFLAS